MLLPLDAQFKQLLRALYIRLMLAIGAKSDPDVPNVEHFVAWH